MRAAVPTILIILLFSIGGNLFVGDALTTWYADLEKPWYLVPLWFFIIIGVLYYVMSGVIFYRLFHLTKASSLRSSAIVLVFFMLIGNELWNYLFFGMRSTFLGFVSLVPFIMIVVVLTFILRKIDRVSFYVLSPYLLWLLYDLIWTYGLYEQN